MSEQTPPTLAVALRTLERLGEEANRLLGEAVITDGGHHKQWYLEQLAELLEAYLPEHEPGIAP